MSTFLADSLDDYLASLDSPLSPAEVPHVTALKLTARTLDAQEEPASSLLSAYMRELARFQKNRADRPASDPLGDALNALDHDK